MNLSRYDYEVAQDIERRAFPFYALVAAAMRGADNENYERLKDAFPSIEDQLQRRYNAPAGWLPEEPHPFIAYPEYPSPDEPLCAVCGKSEFDGQDIHT